MELDLQWLLIGLPVVFALGWMASRLDLRQLKRERDDSPRAYFKGLNLLLNEQQDQAIDAFIEAVQNDPDTTELHFALGNLFRRRGEFERAVRVHEHLLGRSDLKAADRERAQLALAQDFMKAGLFDRAEAAWRALQGTRFDGDAQLALLSLYERSRDWVRAVEVAHRLDAAEVARRLDAAEVGHKPHSADTPRRLDALPAAQNSAPHAAGSFASRIAHYECEIAEAADARGDSAAAEAALLRAQAAAPQAVRTGVLSGRRWLRQGQPALALQAWDRLREQHPAAFLLVAQDYAAAALATGQQAAAKQALQDTLKALPAVELLRALHSLQAPAAAQDQAHAPPESPQEAQPELAPLPSLPLAQLLSHLQLHPSLSAAQLLLDLPPTLWTPEAWDALRQAIAHSATPLQRYRCAACGFEARHYFWQCPGCLSWDSYPTQRIDAQ